MSRQEYQRSLLVAMIGLIGGAMIEAQEGAAPEPRRERIAVVDFQVYGDVGVRDAEKIVPRLLLSEFTGKFELVDRTQLEVLLKEQNLQMSDLMAPDKALRNGKLIPVRYLVVGEVMKGADFYTTARLVEVGPGIIRSPRKVSAVSFREMEAKITLLARLLQMDDKEYQAWVGKNEAAGPSPAAPDPTMPRGWTSETRRVRVATPQGDEWKEIPYYTNTIGMALVLIPPGEFLMGDTISAEEVERKWGGWKLEWSKGDYPRHRVRITRGFYLGACAVTRGQFAQFVRETGYRTDAERGGKAYAMSSGIWADRAADWRNPLFEQTDAHPVVCVSWNDAAAFCGWLARKEGLDYALPSEAQWEYAARAGTTSHWYWGDEDAGAQGRACVAGEGESWQCRFTGVRDGWTRTAPVGTFTPNAFGLYDMIGNVSCWCRDWFGRDTYASSPPADPEGPNQGTHRSLRGGSWNSGPSYARSAHRDGCPPDFRSSDLGFRVACEAR